MFATSANEPTTQPALFYLEHIWGNFLYCFCFPGHFSYYTQVFFEVVVKHIVEETIFLLLNNRGALPICQILMQTGVQTVFERFHG